MWQNIVIKLVLGLLGLFMKEIYRKIVDKKVMDKLLVLAAPHVENFAKSTTMSNDDKRKAAVAALKDDCKRLGIEAKDFAIDTATQVAYGFLKSKLTEVLG